MQITSIGQDLMGEAEPGGDTHTQKYSVTDTYVYIFNFMTRNGLYHCEDWLSTSKSLNCMAGILEGKIPKHRNPQA
jgi:hypothetical protein